VKIVICLPTRECGKHLIAMAIATSSATYRFCSALIPIVTAYVIRCLLVIIPRVSWIAPPIPTNPFLSDELVVIRIP
jgi:hypothetical protein